MKKYLSTLAAGVIITGCLSVCISGECRGAEDAGKIQIVTTIFPEYDWVMNILGENPADAEVTMLLDSGVDLHSYQPTADDILKIATCDLFIYVGGASDAWVDNALQEAVNEDMTIISLLDVLGDSAKEEEVVDGMQDTDQDHEHGHDEDGDGEDEADENEDGEGHDHGHKDAEAEYDEHVWLSLRNASVLVRTISDAVQAVDPEHADVYEENTSAYISELETLDAAYQDAVDAASFHTLLFGDRFPFRYLTDDYGLDYYAAFSGCSAETEASFETITFLSQKLDELALPAIMTIEGTDHRIAETIVRSTKSKNQQILVLDSMQSVTAGDAADGVSYLSIMENNLSVLKEALK